MEDRDRDGSNGYRWRWIGENERVKCIVALVVENRVAKRARSTECWLQRLVEMKRVGCTVVLVAGDGGDGKRRV